MEGGTHVSLAVRGGFELWAAAVSAEHTHVDLRSQDEHGRSRRLLAQQIPWELAREWGRVARSHLTQIARNYRRETGSRRGAWENTRQGGVGGFRRRGLLLVIRLLSLCYHNPEEAQQSRVWTFRTGFRCGTLICCRVLETCTVFACVHNVLPVRKA